MVKTTNSNNNNKIKNNMAVKIKCFILLNNLKNKLMSINNKFLNLNYAILRTKIMITIIAIIFRNLLKIKTIVKHFKIYKINHFKLNKFYFLIIVIKIIC